MVERLGDALLELRTDDKGFTAGVDKAETRARQLGRQLDAVGKRAQRLGRNLSIGLTAPIAALGGTSLKAFTVQERAIAKVEAALEATGGAVGLTSEQLQQMASELQQVSTFGDEDILENLTAGLLRFTSITGDQFVQAQRLAVDAAAQTGASLEQMARQIGLALESPADGLTLLRRSGVVFGEEIEEAVKRLAEEGRTAEAQGILFEGLAERFGGAAEALAQTTEGNLKQVNNAWGDFQEQIGQIIAEVLPPLTDLLRDVVDFLQDLDPKTLAWATAIAAVAAAIGPVVGGLGLMVAGIGALLPVIATLSTAILGLVAASGPLGLLALAVGGIVLAWQKWDQIGPILQAVAEAAEQWLRNKLGAVLNFVGDKVRQVKGFFADLFNSVVGNSFIPDLVDGIAREFSRLPQVMVAPAQETSSLVQDAFSRAASTIQGTFQRMIGGLIDGSLNAKQALGSLLQDLSKIARNTALRALFGGGDGGGGLLGGLFGGLFAGGFASGGTIPSGRFGIVGERGPEPVFGPATVFPTSALEGGRGEPAVVINQTFDARGADNAAIARLERAMERDRRELPRRVVATMREARSRRVPV